MFQPKRSFENMLSGFSKNLGSVDTGNLDLTVQSAAVRAQYFALRAMATHAPLFNKAKDGAVLLSDPKDLEALFYLRGRMFQTEGKRGYHSVVSDHSAFVEKCDFVSLQSGYFRDGQLLYGIRRQPVSSMQHNPNYDLVWPLLEAHDAHDDVLMTRFVNSGQAQSRLGIAQLLALNYKVALADKIERSFITCAAGHVPFFRRLGYKYLTPYTCPHAGLQVLTCLRRDDHAHLADIKSPFYKIW